MTTKIRATRKHVLESIDSIYRAIKENGGKDIVKWLLRYTGESSNAEAEIDAPDAAFDGSVEEVSTILFTKTKINTIGSEYLSVPFSAAAGGGSETMHYFWVSKPEITTVTFTLTKALMTDASSFDFEVDDGDGTVTHYYVWFDKTGSTVDPTGTGTGVEADISLATTANDVAEIVKDLIHALSADVSCTQTAGVMTIVNANNGIVEDAVESIEGTGCTFSIEEGGDDPSATGTGHAVDISTDTTAANVADAFNTAIDAIAGITSTVSTATVTIESDNTGNITDIVQSASSLGTITVINQGRDSYEGGYLYLVSASADDTDAADKDTREVTVTGWDENGEVINVPTKMAGTTYVKLDSRLKAVSHMFGSLFGSAGQDAKGNITLETTNTGTGATLLTIAATYVESNGARIYVPDGSRMAIDYMDLFQITNTNTGETIVKEYTTGFESARNIDPDFDFLAIVTKAYDRATTSCKLLREVRIGTNTAVIIVKEREIAVTGNETFIFTMIVYTFK